MRPFCCRLLVRRLLIDDRVDCIDITPSVLFGERIAVYVEEV